MLWTSLLCCLRAGYGLAAASTSAATSPRGSGGDDDARAPPLVDAGSLAPPPLLRVWRFSSDDGPHAAAAAAASSYDAAAAGRVGVAIGPPGADTPAWLRVACADAGAPPPLHTLTAVCAQSGELALGSSFTLWEGGGGAGGDVAEHE